MALREINLIPSDIMLHRYLVRHMGLWAGLLAILLAPIVSYYIYQTKVALSYRPLETTLGDITRNINTKLQEIKTVQNRVKKVNHRLSDIESVTSQQSYALILFKLSKAVNRYLWLRSLSIQSQSKNSELLINGYALSNEAIGDLLNRLSTDELFEKVVLNYARQPSVGKKKARLNEFRRIEFEIRCDITRR
ncbi:MAG: PilN domain-containing protein [Deltaproteobacteria bacterium]|nr:PilN domain-containing protein [Deltaproteobacteria bacterium]